MPITTECNAANSMFMVGRARHGPHRYHFRLLALSTDHLSVRKDPSCRNVEREARKHVLAEAVLVGVYEVDKERREIR
jgi:phosphatidylethanolamine-binding protein (PEBP) family uncharacterized protein